jgi:signal transduction histidine kinase
VKAKVMKLSLSLSPVYKESPEAVDLLQLITSEFRPYKVILKSRQIRYSVQIPEGITFTTSKNLFAKAVSNVLSNAANYTDSGGEVRIFYAENCLNIENTCKPLSEEELQLVMKPMYSGKHGNQLSNGLGLYIVNQSLNLLKLSFSFTPTDSGDGMRFAIRLQ